MIAMYVTTDTLPQIRDRNLLIGLKLSGDQIWSKFIPIHIVLRCVGPKDYILTPKGQEGEKEKHFHMIFFLRWCRNNLLPSFPTDTLPNNQNADKI